MAGWLSIYSTFKYYYKLFKWTCLEAHVCRSRILADQLTLCQPEGGGIFCLPNGTPTLSDLLTALKPKVNLLYVIKPEVYYTVIFSFSTKWPILLHYRPLSNFETTLIKNQYPWLKIVREFKRSLKSYLIEQNKVNFRETQRTFENNLHILFNSAKTWHVIVCWFLFFPQIYLSWT